MNIVDISYQIAKDSTSVASLSDFNEIPVSEAKVLEKMMGLKRIPRDPSISVEYLLIQSLSRMLEENPINHLDVKYLLLAHTSDQITPLGDNLLMRMQERFQFTEAVIFGSTTYKCASSFKLIEIANRLFDTLSEKDYIVILVADVAFTKILKYIPRSTVMGDSASTILLSNQTQKHHFICSNIKLYGKYAKGIWGSEKELNDFQVNYTDYLSDMIKNLVTKAGLNLTDIGLILPHNVNTTSWRQVINQLTLSKNQVYLENVSRLGHCFGSDPFINLKDALSQNILGPGNYYILVTVGLGATFAGLLFQY